MASPRMRTRTAPFYAEAFFGNFSADLAIWSFFLTEVHGVSLPQAVAAHTLIFLTVGLCDLPTGAWADLFGRRRVLVCGYLCRIAGAVLTLAAGSYSLLLVASLLTGFGWAQLSGANRSWLYDNLKAQGETDHFPRVFSNYWSAMFVSRCLAFGSAGVLFTLNPALPYLLMIAALSMAIAVMLIANEELPFTAATGTTTWTQLRGALAAVRGATQLRLLIGVFLGMSIASDSAWVVIQPLCGDLGLSTVVVGGIYAGGALASALGAQLTKTPWMRGYFVRGFTVLTILYALAGILLGTAESPSWLFVLGLISFHLAVGVLYPLFEPSIQTWVESSHRATVSSMLSAATGLIVGGAGVLLGWVAQSFGAGVIFLLLPPAALAVLGVVVRTWRKGAVQSPAPRSRPEVGAAQ